MDVSSIIIVGGNCLLLSKHVVLRLIKCPVVLVFLFLIVISEVSQVVLFIWAYGTLLVRYIVRLKKG